MSEPNKEAILSVQGLGVWYGQSHVVQDVSFVVNRGEVITLMGRNGAGKTSTLRGIMGLPDKRAGTVTFEGRSILQEPAHTRYHLGIGLVPEDRRIVAGLTVRENLELGLIASNKRANTKQMIDKIAQTFPRLKERLDQEATSMSGGEQQMLAIARAMMSEPKLILLDEPSEGIMPVLVDEMFELFVNLRNQGVTVLLVEQNVSRALAISDRAYIFDQGRIVHEGSGQALLNDAEIQSKYCAV